MRSRVSPATGPLSFSTRDTVATDTPAARATSRMVTRMDAPPRGETVTVYTGNPRVRAPCSPVKAVLFVSSAPLRETNAGRDVSDRKGDARRPGSPGVAFA